MSDEQPAKQSLADKVDEMAHAIADTVIGQKHVDKQDLDAFRILCQYLGVKRKINPSDDDGSQGGSFDDWGREA